jgi:RecA/RadA recombinase
VSLDNLKTIRAGVADALIADETTGHSGVAEVIDAVGGRLASDFLDSYHAESEENGCASGGPFHPTFRPPQLIVGSLSALELAAHFLCVGSIEHVSTGSDGLDQLIGTNIKLNVNLGYPFNISPHDDNGSNNNGGLPFGFITEVSGPPCSAKTQFCLSVVANALRMKTKVIYITSGNAMGLCRRLFSLCVENARMGGANGDANELMNSGDMTGFAEQQMKGVSIVSSKDAYDLLGLLAKIEQQELCNADSNEAQSTLLVIDSISGVIGHHLSNLTKGAALMNQIGLTLRRMTRTLNGRFVNKPGSNASPQRFGIVIANGTVTNWSETSDKNICKPAMGRYWHVSDIGLWMEEESQDETIALHDLYLDGTFGLNQGKKKIRATLVNHWAKKCGGCTELMVRSGGVSDA